MVDYTLTVSVSIAAGVAAITSAIAPLRGHEVALSLALLGLIVVANLRGVRESGRLFAPPTYLYIVMMSCWSGGASIRVALGDLGQLHVNHPALDHFTGGQAVLAGASSFLLLRAFSSGAVALSGVEAISNGVQAFRKPESRNAAITLTAVATILGTLFLGIAVLAAHLRPTLSPDETILSTMGHAVFGTGPLYWLLQASTAMILTLSANTAFADFPRLAGIVATDGFLPRQLANRGDRLVLSNGILVLALAAGVLLVAFGGDVSALIPLFAVGLFLAFTLSQTGMVVHHWRLREAGWKRRLAINAVGATATGRRHHRRRGLEVHRGRLDTDRRHPAAGVGVLVDQVGTTGASTPPSNARPERPSPRSCTRSSCSSVSGSTPACWSRSRTQSPSDRNTCMHCTSRSTPHRPSRCRRNGPSTGSTFPSTSWRPRTESSPDPSSSSSKSSTSGGTMTSSP